MPHREPRHTGEVRAYSLGEDSEEFMCEGCGAVTRDVKLGIVVTCSGCGARCRKRGPKIRGNVEANKQAIFPRQERA